MLQTLKDILFRFLTGRVLPYVLALFGLGGVLDYSAQNEVLINTQKQITEALQETSEMLKNINEDNAEKARKAIESALSRAV